uniref:Uncharacterized protein n=1 Tax=uncultured Bacillota bacterium TaxID=344338 RepID=A0A650EMK6_9FIRM|nr:hypothetical protein Firmicute1046_1530 [uncultured Firmicutes bacterium]
MADNTICKSVFKNGKSISTSQFTQKFIELINLSEKNKSVKLGDK